MFKSELKSGMVVVYRNGDARTVLKETPFGNMITSADRVDNFGNDFVEMDIANNRYYI